MDRITEALTKLLPEDQVNDVAQAVQAMLSEAKEELDKEFNTKLEEAFEQAQGEIKSAEEVAEQGYAELLKFLIWTVDANPKFPCEAITDPRKSSLERET